MNHSLGWDRTAARSTSKKERPCPASRDSSRWLQSQSEQAQGSEPFKSRQRCRLCASCTRTSSKKDSQYGRSSAKGKSQKHTSTHLTLPCAQSRASCILRRYSPSATDPAPSFP